MIPSHDMQAYFTAFTLLHQVCPTKLYGMDRVNLERYIANQMHLELATTMPAWYVPVARATKEVGANPHGFMLNLAEAYLNWLYAKSTTTDCDG